MGRPNPKFPVIILHILMSLLPGTKICLPNLTHNDPSKNVSRTNMKSRSLGDILAKVSGREGSK